MLRALTIIYIQLLFQVKEDVEEETGETFDKFKAVYFLKRDFNYVIRVRRRYLVYIKSIAI